MNLLKYFFVVGDGAVSTTIPCSVSFEPPVSTIFPLKVTENSVKPEMELVTTVGIFAVGGLIGLVSLFFLQLVINRAANKMEINVFIVLDYKKRQFSDYSNLLRSGYL